MTAQPMITTGRAAGTEPGTVASSEAGRLPTPAPSRLPAPGTVVPMRVFIWLLIVLPRLTVLGWMLVTPAQHSVPAWLWLGGLAIAPFTAMVLLIAGTTDLDPLDWAVVGLAGLSDLLVWVVLRFERRYGPSARADRVDTRNGRGPGTVPKGRRSALQQWFDMMAMGMPWPGMRLQAALRGWPADCRLSKQDLRLMNFVTYDSTARSMYWSTPAWIAGLLALAVVNNSDVDWTVRMLVAALGPVVTIVVVVVVSAQNAQFRVVLPMVKALRLLYRTTPVPLTTLDVRRVNRYLAHAADALQRLPVHLHSSHPVVVRDAAEKAAAMSALQEDVTSGVAKARRRLPKRLRNDLTTILMGRWRTLPGQCAQIRVQGLTRWQKAGLVLAAAALLGAAVWVGARGWGEATGPVIAALVGLAMAALIKSGVAPGGLQQAIDLGKGAIALTDAAAHPLGGNSTSAGGTPAKGPD